MTNLDSVSPDQDDIMAERDAQRYVLGRMTEEEEQQFEISMLEHPEIAVHVKLTRQLRVGPLPPPDREYAPVRVVRDSRP
jgi:hypothetical protein